MNATAASILGASLIIAASIASFSRPLAAPAPASTAESTDVGRYQTIRHGNYLVMTDTKTGRNWQRYLAADVSSGYTSWQEESVR
jgi:hypothetical protein